MVCNYNITLPDDPIVFPNQPGASHSHDEAGSTAWYAFVTAAQYRAGGTTCRGEPDTAAYWMPTPYLPSQGGIVHFDRVIVYYSRDPQGAGPVYPQLPPSLTRLVGGNRAATSPAENPKQSFDCLQHPEVPPQPEPINCAQVTGDPNSQAQIKFRFPNCWDGLGSNYTDFVYAKPTKAGADGNACPVGHTPIPQIRVAFVMPVADLTGLSYGADGQMPWWTGHADADVRGWKPALLAENLRENDVVQ